MRNIIMETKSVTKEYGQGEGVINALDTVSLAFLENEFCIIMGKSGSGKSTLLHLLGGLDTPTSGSVLCKDKDINTLNDSQLSKFRREQVGFVFQFFNLMPELTAKENIILPVLINKSKINEKRIEQLVEVLEIGSRLSHLPCQLSGGQQQRVAIARALANDPEILLCDEPTGNLDEKSSEEVMNLLRTVHKEMKKTIIMVTHNPLHIRDGDRVIRLQDGKVVEEIE